MNRRNFINTSIVGTTATLFTGVMACSTTPGKDKKTGPAENASSMTGDVSPISLDEIKSRIRKAQGLMQQQDIGALLLDAGTSLTYYTGLSWGQSERPMVAVIPASGEVSYICPGFEESRLREIIKVGAEVYPWQEDESPYAQIARAIKEAGVSSDKIGIEERLRFFIYNGVKKEAPQLEFVSGDPVTIPCRIIKSPAELSLMQKATDITSRAIPMALNSLEVGSSPADFSHAIQAAHTKLGARHAFGGCNFAEASALPHGSIKPQSLKNGDVVLVDCGCTVEGYHSDISRTVVFGAEPTKRQQEIWDLEKKAQAAGFEAARLGEPLQNVDAAARKVITDAGFGPGYQLPGLPHRTGHGIGMDTHEWGYAVKGNERLLEPGMCFSIEPNISIVGEFGVRLEDCAYMTADGPQWFSRPSPSIDQPFVV